MNRVDIDEVWPTFEPLAHIAMAHEDDGPDDIREACHNGSAWIFADDDGFLVLQYTRRPGKIDRMQLVVWLAVAHNGRVGCIDKHEPWIREQCVKLGASRILARTRRLGLERALPPGWKLEHIVLALEL